MKSEAFGWVNCLGINPSHVSKSPVQHPLALKVLLAHWLHRSSPYMGTLSTK